MTRARIRAVALDYGNVLSRRQDPVLVTRLHILAGLSPEEFTDRYLRRRLDYDRGDLTTADYWADAVGGDLVDQPGRLAEMIRTDVASWLQLDHDMVAWARALKGAGIATAILSNMPPDILDGLRRDHSSVLDEFDVTIFSCEIGSVKPEPHVYELLLERLGLPAASVLFVDDREENVAAAIRLGMQGVRYDSPEEFWLRLDAEYDLPGVTSLLLREQVEYYRARAGEYDEWFFRDGRYDRGPAHRAAWLAEVAIVEAALAQALAPGAVLELACGTGLWTRRLAEVHASVLAVDASPEVIALNRQRVGSDRVTYGVADLFNWNPPAHAFDAVFFGFWLSHVPWSRFDAFWGLVREALKPGGTVFFVDSLLDQTSTATDHDPIDESGVVRRKLNDGREFSVVKVFHEPAVLEQRLFGLGWTGRIQSSGRFFLYGSVMARRP